MLAFFFFILERRDPLIGLIAVIVLIIIIALFKALTHNPNKWYGKMVCNKCGYQWQSRRTTPPTRCPSCSSKLISTQTDAQAIGHQQSSRDSTNTDSTNMQSFLPFCGFTRGDTLDKAQRILGQPQQVMDNPQSSFVVLHYFLDEYNSPGFAIYLERHTDRIMRVELNSAEGILQLKARGITDSNMSYLGQHVDFIKATFGKPVGEESDNFEYHIYQPPNPNYIASVTFTCFEFENYDCSTIACSGSLTDWYY